MASAASLAKLQAEATCPICLAYLNDPVTTECGHNFCYSCILQCWEDLQETFPCPTCLQFCLSNDLQSNRQLHQLVEIVMQLGGTQSKEAQCEQHKEALSLFCEEDLKLLCTQCGVAPDHRHHHLLPIEEAAAAQKQKLKKYQMSLKEQMRNMKMAHKRLISKYLRLIPKMQKWRKELQLEFERFQEFMSTQYHMNIAYLTLGEKAFEAKLWSNISEILDHLAKLKSLGSEMTEKSQQADDVDFLRGVRSLQERYNNARFPPLLSFELEEITYFPPHYFGLEKLMCTFQVDLTFNPKSSHPDILTVSNDKRTVALVTQPNGADCSSPLCATIQGQDRFQSGRAFWQVEMKGTGQYSLGVCEESVETDSQFLYSRSIGQDSNPSMRVGMERVGIFLDYELGEVSFYDMKNRACLYCACTAEFRGALVPFFSIKCHFPSSLSISFDSEEE